MFPPKRPGFDDPNTAENCPEVSLKKVFPIRWRFKCKGTVTLKAEEGGPVAGRLFDNNGNRTIEQQAQGSTTGDSTQTGPTNYTNKGMKCRWGEVEKHRRGQSGEETRAQEGKTQ